MSSSVRFVRRALVLAVVLLAACGGGTTATVTFPTSSTVAPAVVRQWPDKWCNEASTGMTKDQLVAVMGEPTTDLYPDQMSWDGNV